MRRPSIIIRTGKLKLSDDSLLGRQSGTDFEPIDPHTIDWVFEYCFFDPRLIVVAGEHIYSIRPWSGQYAGIVDWVEKHAGLRVKGTLAHRQNGVLFGWIGRSLSRTRQAH